MEGFSVHFEVYIRRVPGASWTLDVASEDRAVALEKANTLMSEGRVAAVKVQKETFDEETLEYRAVDILKLGAAEVVAKSRPKVESQAICVTPQDLYTGHARERIGRLLEGWLERNQATPFDLLHRPDLAEKLEASNIDLHNAIQKVAGPEAHARGVSVQSMVTAFQTLVARTIERLIKDARKGVFPDLDKEGFAPAAERLISEPERGYLLSVGIAAAIAGIAGWSAKVARLMDLADAAPTKGPARSLALITLQQPLAEILEGKPGMDDITGKGRDLGANLAAMTRLAAYHSVDRLIQVEASVAKVMPALSPLALRLAILLAGDHFQDTRAAVGRRILRELIGPRRLRPGDAAGEIDMLRALGMSLTVSAGKLLPLEDVQAAFTARSKMLVTGDFVEAYLGHDMSPRDEIEALIWLTENVIGASNKRLAGGWIKASVNSLRFEKDMLANGAAGPAARLAQLAKLQRSIGHCGLVAEDFGPLQERLGELGGEIESRANLATSLSRAEAPLLHRLTLLLKLAAGETAPLGPAANRAKSEAIKLVRHTGNRAELAATPGHVETVHDLIQQAGLAA